MTLTVFSGKCAAVNAFKEDWITKWQLNGFKNANK